MARRFRIEPDPQDLPTDPRRIPPTPAWVREAPDPITPEGASLRALHWLTTRRMVGYALLNGWVADA